MTELSKQAIAAIDEFKTLLADRGIEHDGTTEGILDAVYQLILEMEAGESDTDAAVAASKAAQIVDEFGQRARKAGKTHLDGGGGGHPVAMSCIFQNATLGELEEGTIIASGGRSNQMHASVGAIRALCRLQRMRKAAKGRAKRRVVAATHVKLGRPAIASSNAPRENVIIMAQRGYEAGLARSWGVWTGSSKTEHPAVDDADLTFLTFREKVFVNTSLAEKNMLPLNTAEVASFGIRDMTGREVMGHGGIRVE